MERWLCGAETMGDGQVTERDEEKSPPQAASGISGSASEMRYDY